MYETSFPIPSAFRFAQLPLVAISLKRRLVPGLFWGLVKQHEDNFLTD